MGGLSKMFSGRAARLEQMKAAEEAQKRRAEAAIPDIDDEEARRASARAQSAAMNRGGRASTRLSSDTRAGGSILGGMSKLGG